LILENRNWSVALGISWLMIRAGHLTQINWFGGIISTAPTLIHSMILCEGSWTGTFDNTSTASDLLWHASSGWGGIHGTAVLQITILDFNFDQIIDPDERAFSVFSGTLVVVKDGSGIWAGYCGLGSFSGSSSNADPVNWADDFVSGSTILDVDICDVPTNNVTWGQVKELYGSN